ncbi:MAG: rRNA pseudouridine synthase [Armatimonadetes bacterium]|nr:rRNA pseudouridine synthase [Armatimonadota bacterium]
MQDDAKEVLHKLISATGVWSRRKAQDLIVEGRVKVDGWLITNKAERVPVGAQVLVDGKPIEKARMRYLALNKPAGVTTTMSDPHAKRTVGDLVRELGVPVKPVGRLDADTEGLLLLTNDGDLAFRLTHPSFGIEKEYEVEVVGEVTSATMDKLEKGIYLEGKRTAPTQIARDAVHVKDGRTKLRIVLHEGRKRQIRQMFLFMGHPVKKLRRMRIGGVRLRGLPKGTFRDLDGGEVRSLRLAVGLEEAPVRQSSKSRTPTRENARTKPHNA